MPLYIDKKIISESFIPLVANALNQILLVTEGIAITPSFALRLIKDHLVPLLPGGPQLINLDVRHPSWSDIDLIHISLAFEGADSEIHLEVARAVSLIYQRTSRKIREEKFPYPIDVTYFLNTCGHMRLPIKDLCDNALDMGIDLFGICKYCWRLAPPSRQNCHVHSIGLVDAGDAPKNLRGPYAENKEGRRQHSMFSEVLNAILLEEVLEFHNTGLKAQIVPPQIDMCQWLKERRPSLWGAISEKGDALNDENVMGVILDVLHNSTGLPTSVRNMYLKANDMFKLHNFLAGPMLLRMEAWYVARMRIGSKWGGARKRGIENKNN